MPRMRPVRLHDPRSGRVKALEPRDGHVGIYACGPTVYSRIHIGNARPYVLFILLRRFLERVGYEPRLVVNVTDINDKIYAAAREAGQPAERFAARMTGAYIEDTDRLELGRPDEEPLASETIAEIVDLIGALIEGGHAYGSGGDVYFRVRSFDGYGKLSNRDPDEMDQGEEAGAAELKESPQDFALWKARKEGEDTYWESPWGEGRPGWHIECSAMAETLLGVDFEVHGGGSDLIFPHHENEIAQTEAARGKPLARLWMHNGMVEMADEKMAKSVGNVRLLHGAIEQFGPDAFLMWLVGSHYRKPVAYTEETLADAARAGDRLRELIRRLDPEGDGSPKLDAIAERFFDQLADDFNTAGARAELFAWLAEANRRIDAGERLGPGRLGELLNAFGLERLLAGDSEVAPDDVELMAAEREEARA